MSTTPAGVKSILGALEYVSHCLPSFKLLGDPLIDIIKVEKNKDFTPTDIHMVWGLFAIFGFYPTLQWILGITFILMLLNVKCTQIQRKNNKT